MSRLYHILIIAFLGASIYLLALFVLPYFGLNLKGFNLAQEKAEVVSSQTPASVSAPTLSPTPSPTRILVLGDMMFDRGVRSQINSKGFDYVFGSSTDMFPHYDKVIANLEGPITTYSSKNVLANNKAVPGFQFTFPANTAEAIKKAGVDIVSLANNHTYNFGSDGLAQTRARLKDADLQYFGSPENNTDIATTTCITQATKICLGIIGWHEFGTKNYQKILDEISTLRPTVDYLIIFPHWGIEYQKEPTELQTKLAHQWLDAGADVIIGAHPHIVEKIEQYKTKDGRTAPIFYSLGNFIFDQYFSFDTTHGIGVDIEFPNINSTSTNSNQIAKSAVYKIIPFESTGSHVSIPNATSTARMIQDIETVSGKDVWNWLQK